MSARVVAVLPGQNLVDGQRRCDASIVPGILRENTMILQAT
jgi:hypothetical protein